jgi:peptidoglycan/LPS O-acetylase OafA/YrhL
LTFTLIVTTVAAYVFLLPGDLVDYSRSLIASSTFWSNIYFWRATNYFSIDAQLRPLLHTWSLSVEEQYYIFAPLLLLFIYRYLNRRWVSVLIPITVLSLICAVLATWMAPTAGFYLLPTRIWELMVGALLMLAKPPRPKNQRVAELVGATGVLLLGVGFLTIDETEPFPGLNALYPCLGAALLIYIGGQADGAERRLPTYVTRALQWRPLVFVGLISYSLYLVHWPISAFTRYLTLREPTLTMAAGMFVASMLLATFSWWYIERPFRQKHTAPAVIPIFKMSAMAIAVACLAGFTGLYRHGFADRFPGFTEEKISGGDWFNGSCFNEGSSPIENWTLQRCTRTNGFSENVLLWGDSFAAHYVSGLGSNVDRLRANIVQYTYAGCPPILSYFSYARPNCTRFNRRALAVIQEAHIKTVILSARWTDYEARGFGGLHDTIATLTGLGVKVYVIGQSPQFPTDVQKIRFFARRSHQSDDSWPMAMDIHINDRLRPFADGATFIDPLSFLCRGERCAYANSQGFLYFDYGHLSQLGAIEAVRSYWPRFAETAAR